MLFVFSLNQDLFHSNRFDFRISFANVLMQYFLGYLNLIESAS